MREAAAYNANILVMVAMPYLLLGIVGIAIYRHHRTHGNGTSANENRRDNSTIDAGVR